MPGPPLDPVRPGGEESGELAERVVGVGIWAARAPSAAHEPRERQRKRERACTDHGEGGHTEPAVVGDRSRDGEDAGADDPTYHDGDGGEQAEPVVGRPETLIGRGGHRHPPRYATPSHVRPGAAHAACSRAWCSRTYLTRPMTSSGTSRPIAPLE